MRRFVTLALSLSLVLGLTTAGRLLAQVAQTKGEVQKEEAKPVDAPKTEVKKEEPKKEEPKKEEPKKEEAKPAEAPLPSIPPEVEAKLEAARRAVAEAIVAAQDAGLVETTIDPPPILDILITGRATDARELKKATKEVPEVGLSPEVFGAWFTGYNKPTEGITADKNVRIVQPSKGLKQWYDTRATLLNRHIAEARKAKADAAKPKDEPKPEEKKEEPKKEEAPKTEEPKKEEAPKAEAPKAEEPKKDEAPKTEAPKTEEPKKDEAPKA